MLKGFKRMVFTMSLLAAASLAASARGWSQTAPAEITATPSDSTSSLEEERKKLEVERMELENEKLKLEMEKLKVQATQTITPKETKEDRLKKLQDYQVETSKKSEAIAAENKEKNDLLILDFINGELWYKGVRYGINEWNVLANDQKWKLRKVMDKRDPGGDEQYLYEVRNVKLVKYSSRPRGILTVSAPVGDESFHFKTPEGLSFDSTEGDVRNAYSTLYYKSNGVGRDRNLKIVRYKHSEGLDFEDKLEFGFDKDGKLVEVRYGVLDEN